MEEEGKEKVFDSIEQAGNYLKEYKAKAKETAKANKFPISTASEGEQRRFLVYAISMLNPKDFPVWDRGQIVLGRNLLIARLKGYTIEGIAAKSGCTVEIAKQWEQDAIRRVKDAISKRVKQGIPVLGMN